MKRRKFMAALGGAATWPLMARAQQSAMPVLGFLNSNSAQGYARPLAAFLKGLAEAGYVDGRNVVIEYRWAEGLNDRLPALAADLVRRQVTVIAATTTSAALAAKAATTTIPIVFETASDPVKIGLVTSLSRPGGNATGVTQTNVETAPKRLQILHESVPTAGVMAFLVNPTDPALAEANTKEMRAAATALGLELHMLTASSESEFEGVFEKLIQSKAGGLVINSEPFFNGESKLLAALAAHYAVPAAAPWPEFAAAGGLMSYGASTTESYRLTGSYAGRVLKGDKPTDLPVQQISKVEFIINLKTAKALGLTIPLPLVGRADEVIE